MASNQYQSPTQSASEDEVALPAQRTRGDAYKTAFPIDGLGGVHEDITKAATKAAGVPYNKSLEKGVEWPDVPSDKPEDTSYKKLVVPKWAGGDLDRPGSLTYESHNGANQFWHSMAPKVEGREYTNGEVLNKIVSQAGAWFDQAKFDNSNFYIGNLLHMVQDSYSQAHVIRDNAGRVVSFQSYDKQDHGAHRHWESKQMVDVEGGPLGNEQGRMQNWQEVPGAMAAYRASVKILELYKNGATSDELKAYLRQEVYLFENEQTQNKPAGEVDPRLAPKPRTRIAESSAVELLNRREALDAMTQKNPNIATNYAAVSAALLNHHEHFSGMTEANRMALAAIVREKVFGLAEDIQQANVMVKVDTHAPVSNEEVAYG